MIKFDKWTDKNTHMVAGTLIAIITGFLFFWLLDERIWLSLLVGLFSGTLAGVVKEFYDLYIKKTLFNFEDLKATFWGAIVGMIILVPIFINL